MKLFAKVKQYCFLQSENAHPFYGNARNQCYILTANRFKFLKISLKSVKGTFGC